MNSKGQLVGQIVIYILAIVIFSLIIIYGYNAIKDFRQKADEVSFIKFKTEITSTVDSISTDYGTVKKETFSLPPEYKKVCFVDKNSGYAGTNEIIKDAAVTTSNNIFLVKDIGVTPIKTGPLVVDNLLKTAQYKQCVPFIDGRVRIRFEGLGDATKISIY